MTGVAACMMRAHALGQVTSINEGASSMKVEVRNKKGDYHIQKLGYPAPNAVHHYNWKLIGHVAHRAPSGNAERAPKVGPAQCSVVQCAFARVG